MLRRLVEVTIGTVDARSLRPVTDELDRQRPGTPAGWSEVRAWCQDLTSFDELFKPEVGDPLDLLVIAIDLDIAIRAGVAKLPAKLKRVRKACGEANRFVGKLENVGASLR